MSRKYFPIIALTFWFILAAAAFACTRTAAPGLAWRPAPARTATTAAQLSQPASPGQGSQALPQVEGAQATPTFLLTGNTPTPDQPRSTPTPRTDPQQYVIQANDTLGLIAKRYGVPLEQLIKENDIANPDLVEPGQVILIPAAGSLPVGPSFKIIPDSELVYGPNAAKFNITQFVQQKNGYLNHYSDTIDNQEVSGAEVVQRVATDYSVNPRILLAVLEYQSGWVTQPKPSDKTLDYPIGVGGAYRKGLYHQLAWAADNLNRGYYLWRAGSDPNWILADGNIFLASPILNAGTAGVQSFFSALLDQAHFEEAVGPNGLIQTYEKLFGYPFNYAFEPIHPADLKQPPMQLPIEKGVDWYLTGGPHGGWAEGSAWAAIDFAPPGEALGCVQSDAWEVAVADGVIVRTGNGAVVEDLDGDGLEQTGWTVLYMHVETRDRIKTGTVVKAGDKIGHPSCEGGVSTGTHLHLARRYNGEWIPADGPIPFNLDGWISQGDGIEYNGYLVKNGVSVEAQEGRFPENQVIR